MSDKYKLDVKGFKNLERELRKFGADGEKSVIKITQFQALQIERDAVKNIKKKVNNVTGTLSRSMFNEKVDKKGLKYRIFSKANYAPYIEFGTGRLVQVPKELVEVARQFIGKGIRQINLPARPFLYPAFSFARKQYIEDLKQELNRLSKKFNK